MWKMNAEASMQIGTFLHNNNTGEAEESDLNMNLNKCEEQIFAQEFKSCSCGSRE